MKKIISVLLVLALVGGMAFADPKISLNFRAKSSILTMNDGNSTWFDAASSTYKGISDSVNLSISEDNYGAELAFNLSGSGIEKLNTYNGWLSFGDLKLGAGVWKDGLLDGNYRTKKDADAGSYEGIDFEANKLGSIFKGTEITFVDNMSGGEGVFTAYAEYKKAINDDLQLNVMFSGYTSEWNKTKTTLINMGGAARVQFNIKGLLNSEFIYKTPKKGTSALALYVQPTMIKNLTAIVGGAIALIDGKDGISNWGVDVRARYQVTKALSITEYFNISGNKEKTKLNKALATNGTWGSATVEKALWNMIGARYIINDTVTAYTNVGVNVDLTENTKNGIMWRVTPGAQIYASKNAFINVGVALSGDTTELAAGQENKTFTVEVPVIFRVKLK